MSNCWVWSTSKEHFEFSFLNHIWATKNKSATNKVKNKDQILFYQLPYGGAKSGIFKGIFDVEGEWNENVSIPKFPKEVELQKFLWKYQIRIIPHLLFDISYTKAKFLPFLQKGKTMGFNLMSIGGGPSNRGRPLSDADVYALLAYVFWENK